MAFAAANTTKVITKSKNPSAKSVEKWKPSASPNSLARTDAMEVPGENSEVGIRFALPITKVTAMVSPKARPKPSITPPITPFWVYGSTTCRTTSHVVHPKPYADSRKIAGVISNTSRITAATKGSTMNANTMPAAKIPMPLVAPPNKKPTIGMPPNRCFSGICM